MNNNRKYNKSLSIRSDEKMETMIDELKEKMLLNTTSIMRLALVTLYKQQIGERANNKGD